MLEQSIVGDGLFDELLEEKQFRTVNDGVDALLKGLHGREGLEGVTEQNNGRVAALGHGHVLQRLQRQILAQGAGREELFQDDDLILNLAKANEKVPVRGGRMDLVAEFI